MMGFKGGKGVPGIVRTGKRLHGIRKHKSFRILILTILAGATIILSTVAFSLRKKKEKNAFNTSVRNCICDYWYINQQNLKGMLLSVHKLYGAAH